MQKRLSVRQGSKVKLKPAVTKMMFYLHHHHHQRALREALLVSQKGRAPREPLMQSVRMQTKIVVHHLGYHHHQHQHHQQHHHQTQYHHHPNLCALNMMIMATVALR